jgi:hypothetical protein
MAWQQRMEAMKATRVDRTTVGGLAIGGLLGLTLGLLIGWVWWPVEWQGTAPVVTPGATAAEFSGGSQFDDVTTRSLFLGATADAYVYSIAQGNRDAAAVATQRLAALGGDLPAAFDEAIGFYAAQPAGAAQVTNLTTLATAVGITPGSSDAAAAAAVTAAPAAVEGAGAPAAAAESQTGATLVAGGGAQASSNNLLGWVLSLLAAALLIGGGIFLLLRLNRGGDMEASSVGPGGSGGDAFDDEMPPGGPPSVPAFDRSTLSSMRAPVAPAASVRSPVERPVAVTGHDPHGFEAEDDEDAYAGAGRRTVSAYQVGDTDDEYTHAPAAGLEDEADDWIDEELEEETEEERPGEDTNSPPAGANASPAVEPPPTRSNLGGTSVRTPPPPTLQPPTPSRFERYQPIDNFTYTYSLGQADTDKGRHIGAPDGDGYLGEYSVGIPQKNGLLDHDMLKPIAMEVVLFEKSDVRSTLTTTRLLLSTYADDHQREEYKRSNPNLAPIVAQPNTRFQLEGNELLLDVLIREVTYTREGFFQNVVLDLAVKRKT